MLTCCVGVEREHEYVRETTVIIDFGDIEHEHVVYWLDGGNWQNAVLNDSKHMIEVHNLSGRALTVFKQLKRAAQIAGFELEYEYYPSYGSVYIKGIDGVYETRDEGMYWLYRVNGEFADTGASNYMLHDHDVVEWVYMHV